MIDVSRLGRCCYDCGNVDIETNDCTFYAEGVGEQTNVQIWCRHWLVCVKLRTEKGRRIMKTYNPPEYHCAQCDRLIITRNPKEYVYKRHDNRIGSPTFHKTLFFCSHTCLTEFERTYPGRKKYGGR